MQGNGENKKIYQKQLSPMRKRNKYCMVKPMRNGLPMLNGHIISKVDFLEKLERQNSVNKMNQSLEKIQTYNYHNSQMGSKLNFCNSSSSKQTGFPNNIKKDEAQDYI